ncbi:class I SAM-dependent DNA methyltransferase [Rhodoplanes sp. Z2-YC6860]|uniref:class I SAM-dependent DNA methyltransferase n=1 Tax=Rhodoplanes sp. Z2-YC6860 TaxID=674703 RepID=UPI00078C2A27|nr:DNA methyltransferase [Rhodoplanes sp. Z2-YC6860]AMN39042.1 DNA methyltransferase, putative [Rhodoplanes sp. Z2-YC6860]
MTDLDPVNSFIKTWRDTGGSELANTQSFINGLTALLGVAAPAGSRSDDTLNDYVFERRVFQDNGDGTESFGRIDCYKRGHFVLEAKQGSDSDRIAAEKNEADLDLFGQTASQRVKRGTARRGTPGWTKAMLQAKGQAERYAKALPVDHGWPPFLLVVDVGYCIEVYADFTGTGKAYAQFPDRASFRIMLEDIRLGPIQERLRAIWENPKQLDPSTQSARATREIATLLATVARRLEARDHSPENVSGFLMRLLFTIFAEDTSLIPKGSFSGLLVSQRGHPETLHHQLSALWEAMDKGTFSPALGTMMRRFNGYLFKDQHAIPIDEEELEVLIKAAKADWTLVEPAIFGTLLERALHPKERAKLGAHYTPRAYVERLVMPTIIEPLRADWLGVRAAAVKLLEMGDRDKARAEVEAFHAKLAQIKVLDPACGTGNFLYVAMSRMKELEAEVVDLLSDLGDYQYVAEISGHTITPENFLGIEVNPRAAAIAQLVLWIGYLQWHFRVAGRDTMPAEPILRDIRTVEIRDALVEWERTEQEVDAGGNPVTRWDGETTKLHPVTGNFVPDETARVNVLRYVKPKVTKWPTADFIIGNPPFIGNKRMRERLGDGYTEAVRAAFKGLPETIDFVMYWWWKAASSMTADKALVRRFGFITTNSITQAFNRGIVEASAPVRIVYAIPDHPWIDSQDGAAVRIAMTVGARSPDVAMLDTVTSETEIPDGSGEVAVTFHRTTGHLTSSLRLGPDIHAAVPLKSNRGLACPGVQLSGQGFVISPGIAEAFSAETRQKLVKRYLTGWEINNRPKGRLVIDAFGLGEDELRTQYPDAYQHLLTHVFPERSQNPRPAYAKNWWLHSEPRAKFRRAFQSIPRYCATSRTSKHRFFVFCDNETIPETKVLIIALNDAFHLGVLNSRFHVHFSEAAGAHLGVGNDPTYNHTECFDPFPFPGDPPAVLVEKIRSVMTALDRARKDAISRHSDLTLTDVYNVIAALQEGRTLTKQERDIHDRGLVSSIASLQSELDELVANSYGWPATITNEDALARLLELNQARAAEEARGAVRWLRPDIQAPVKVAPVSQTFDLGEIAVEPPSGATAPWPKTLPEQVTAISRVLMSSPKPLTAREVARLFDGKRATSIEPVLNALAAVGQARRLADGRFAS